MSGGPPEFTCIGFAPASVPSSACLTSTFLIPILSFVPKDDPEPECFAQLKYRDIEWSPDLLKSCGITDILPANHAFWWVQDRSGQRHIISGGPSKPTGIQFLNGWVVDGDKNGDDNSTAATSFNSGSSAFNCLSVDLMLAAAKGFPSEKIGYNPQDGPNSNSFARFIGRVGGFNPKRPPRALGWGAYIDLIH